MSDTRDNELTAEATVAAELPAAESDCAPEAEQRKAELLHLALELTRGQEETLETAKANERDNA